MVKYCLVKKWGVVVQKIQNLARTIVGKHEAIRLVIVALLGGGHALLEDLSKNFTGVRVLTIPILLPLT
ncbi:MAG: hypothetical protein ACKPA8_23600, partial [Dolichospermum sp.]